MFLRKKKSSINNSKKMKQKLSSLLNMQKHLSGGQRTKINALKLRKPKVNLQKL